MNDNTGAGPQQDRVYLGLMAWDVDRWMQSDTHLGAPLLVQGAYLNLCFSAYRAQPACALTDRDEVLWRLAGCSSLDEWRALKPLALAGPWRLTDDGWVNEVVLETYEAAWLKFSQHRRAGLVGGRASGRVRRAASKLLKKQPLGTTVQRPLNELEALEVEGERELPMGEEYTLDPSGENTAPTPDAAAPSQDPALFPLSKPSKRSKPAEIGLHLVEERAKKFIALFNDLFKRRVGVTPGIRDALRSAFASGYTIDDVLVATVAAFTDPWLKERNADKSLVPEWLLRFKGGHNRESGRPAKKWLEDNLARVDTVVLTPKLREITDRHEITAVLVERGARVPQPRPE